MRTPHLEQTVFPEDFLETACIVIYTPLLL